MVSPVLTRPLAPRSNLWFIFRQQTPISESAIVQEAPAPMVMVAHVRGCCWSYHLVYLYSLLFIR